MSNFYPHININALKKFAIATAAAENRNRSTRRGKAPAKPNPEIASIEDVVWAGEKMIEINFVRSSLPLGPYCMMAQFTRTSPRSRMTLALVGMMTTAQDAHIKVPKIYAYKDSAMNTIGAEVVLLEKIPGDNLEALWPSLSSRQQIKICVKLAELLLDLFNVRGALICSDLIGNGIDTRPASVLLADERRRQHPIGSGATLVSPPFCDGALGTWPPPQAFTTTQDYLDALCYRIERMFDGTVGPEFFLKARETGRPEQPLLTTTDMSEIRETWHRLGQLIPYHTGGFYLPKTLSSEARQSAVSVLQSRQFGIHHSEMDMDRFIVRFLPDANGSIKGEDAEVELTLCTGWEHAYRAPLWSCARMPPWLTNHSIIPRNRQAELRQIIFSMMNDPRMYQDRAAWQWVTAYVHGVPERWFEGCLSAHWMFGRNIEELLVSLKDYWQIWKKDIPFPLPVGEHYRPRQRTKARVDRIRNLQVVSPPTAEDLDSTDELFSQARVPGY
ncbi:hypothetical protein BJ138DRAFT_1006336 [Hygrophoropsis aurantiaca]|uniref:Uncharacterized protein n=1 Tax=Hygrophoropsis aurantiaca TaxID=72124 RepID=A0ACB8AFB0_9AGAM|nr:hypothetical protein BJ138DRAFT_1006336 [Hygrophoropsis aurantiaca]